MRRARISLITLSAAMVVAACSSCGGDAYGAAGDVIISPAQARPGMEVEIRTSACKGDWAIARSEAFVAEARLNASPDGYALWGEATVRSTAQSQRYQVRVRCDDGNDAMGQFSVVGNRPHPPNPDPWRNDAWRPQPWRPVHAGGGGTASETAEKNAERPETLASARRTAADLADELALGAGLATLIGFAGRRLWIRRRGRG